MMKESRRRTLLLMLIASLLVQLASAEIFQKNGSDIRDDSGLTAALQDQNVSLSDYSIQFFFNTHCGACQNVVSFLRDYRDAHPDIQIQYTDLFDSTENRKRFEEEKTTFHRDQISVPVIFIGNIALEGQNAIMDRFDRVATWYQQHAHQKNTTYTIG